MHENKNEHSSQQALGLTVYDLPDPIQVADADARRTAGGRLRMLLVMLICAAPVVASYMTYYVIRPQATKQFGELIQPVKPMPDLLASSLTGQTVKLSELKGQWLLISVSTADCDALCQTNLLLQRQIRASLGREKDRTDWVWLITDDAAVSPALKNGLTDAVILRIAPAQLSQWLQASEGHAINEHLYLVDPRGDWMMRFPPGLTMSQAAPLKRDWDRLLRASASWDKPGRSPHE